MKLISIYTPSHQILKDHWFLPSLQDAFEISIHRCEVSGKGIYMEKDWTEAILFKCNTILDTIKKNWGTVFVYADVDIQLFAPMQDELQQSIENKDIVCQLDDPYGNLCTGFFAVRANELTLQLWQEVRKAIHIERRDQHAFNRLIHEMKAIRFGYLPAQFFGAGTFNAKIWQMGQRFYIPKFPIMFHANWTVGVDNKIALSAAGEKYNS